MPNVDLNNNEIKPSQCKHLKTISKKKSIKRKRTKQICQNNKSVLMSDLNRLKTSFINSVYVDKYYLRFKTFYATFLYQNFSKINHYNYLIKSNPKSYMKHFKRLFELNKHKKILSFKPSIMMSPKQNENKTNKKINFKFLNTNFILRLLDNNFF